MPDYDFHGLAPSEFESLCQDLLQHALSVPLQSFTTGRDRGIDLRHAPAPRRDWIVQCKHYVRSGYSALVSHIKNKELPKVKKLNPSRYFVATSVGLTPSNVDELFDVLSPYCASKHDIFGRDDLNCLLRSHPEVEQAHFKLWLTSEAVLSRVLNNDVFVQSSLTQEQIRQRLSLYVHTGSFEKALTKLDQDRVCILSGVPGIGKTTLAEMILVEYMMKDWQVIAMHQNVNEGQRIFRHDPNAKQVFYYDDFLGQISTGDKLGKNEDRALLQLIASITRTANKRFILTTREYILARAKAEHEQLARSSIDLYKFVVKCEDYSDLDKARILANHLYFARVPQEHIAAVVEGRSYRKIISHPNYSPRVIEWMTNATATSSCQSAEYPKLFLRTLDNPAELWKHAFENQISEAGRNLLLVLASCGDGIYVSDLQECFDSFYHYRARLFGFPTFPSCFEKALNQLEGNFIRIDRSESQLVISFHNPSVLDFLTQRISHSQAEMADLLQCANFFDQITRLFYIFGLVASRGRRGFDASIVEQAIDRTLLSRHTSLARAHNRSDLWRRRSVSIWERLLTCCRIASGLGDKKLQMAVIEHIEAQMSTIETRSGEAADITALFDFLTKCDWCDNEIVRRWNEKLFQSLLAMNDDLEESLDGLAATATWFAANRQQFIDEHANLFVGNLSKNVTREAEYRSTDEDDPERLGGDLAAVQEIAKALKLDFDDEEEWLMSAIREREKSSSSDDGDSWRERPWKGCESSIEAMFDALLE